MQRCVKGWGLKARETLQEPCAGKPASKDDRAERVGFNEAAPSEKSGFALSPSKRASVNAEAFIAEHGAKPHHAL